MHTRRILQALPTAGLMLLLSACASLEAQAPAVTTATVTPTASPRVADLTRYVDTLAAMAPGDPARQQTTLDAARAAADHDPSAANRLRYALALGCAGHAGSDPIEAQTLMTELLASNHGLHAFEVELASAFLREFSARVTLFAELGRQREESERRLQGANDVAELRTEAIAAENARLRRALAAAERKLEAVAEMERSLLDQAGEPTSEPTPPPQP